jgi:putative Holliday junction resolvase
MAIVNVMGFDFGLKSIGVAVGQVISCTASPVGAIKVISGNIDFISLDVIVENWGPDAFVLGLSLHMDGRLQKFHSQLVCFKKSLQKRYGLEVFWSDERLSTVEAKEILYDGGGRKKLTKSNIDAMSAKVILQQWLEFNEH